jgi:hypothetical protein
MKKMKTIQFLLFFTPFIFQKTAAQTADSKKYYLLFSAREASIKPFSLAGHAFVSWGIAERDSQICSQITYGFYPTAGHGLLAELFQKKRGKVIFGFMKNSNRRKILQVIARTDSATWHETRDTAQIWVRRGYNLLDQNCVKFIDDIAETVGLRTPRTRMLLGFPRRPTNYVHRLYKKNKRRTIENRGLTFDRKEAVENAIYFGTPPNLPETRREKRKREKTTDK